jgi:hypothetical protein
LKIKPRGYGTEPRNEWSLVLDLALCKPKPIVGLFADTFICLNTKIIDLKDGVKEAAPYT